MSRRAALDPISQNGHVYGLDLNPGSLFRTSGRNSVRRVGVHRASTFYGFCSAHDAGLFREIDETSTTIGRERALGHFYRALCHEIYKKEWSLKFCELLTGKIGENPMLRGLQSGSAWAVLSLFEHLERCEASFRTGSADEFCYEAFKSSDAPFVVASSVWFPDFDFQGAKLQDVPQIDHLPACVGLHAFPSVGGSVVMLTWHRDSSGCVQRLLHSLATSFSDDGVGGALIRMVLSQTENAYFKPAWWEAMSATDHRLYLSTFDDAVDLTTPPLPSLRALDALPVVWQAQEVESQADAA